MAYENLLYDKKDGIARITFSRPKVLNALNRKTVEELRDALLDARDDASVRVVILTGAGEKSFVAGADIGELAQRTPVDGKRFSFVGNLGQAFDLCHQRLCVGRRMRVSPFLLDSPCQQKRQARSARS